ncbi:MAG: hypothetical protein IT182_14670 [Acidobacteria bacterium]|nr:hypothetical protein [Acidobacteriota bacterium]
MTMTFDEEYRALHAAAVWADRSGCDARIDVSGPDATDWLQGLLTQDMKALQPGQGAEAAYLTPQGRMIAHLVALRRAASFLLEVPASISETVRTRLDQFVITEDVAIQDVSASLGCLTVLGPRASATVAQVTGLDATTLDTLTEYAHVATEGDAALVVATREFGVPGFDLLADPATLAGWRAAADAAGVREAEAGLLHTARIEAGRPRFGVDMHEDTIPLEAGLESRAIGFDKGCYVGQEVVIRILHRGQGRVARRLVWVEHTPCGPERQVWEPGTEVRLGDKIVGKVGSACWSPSRGGLLCIAMVHRDAFAPGTVVTIDGLDATVRALP